MTEEQLLQVLCKIIDKDQPEMAVRRSKAVLSAVEAWFEERRGELMKGKSGYE